MILVCPSVHASKLACTHDPSHVLGFAAPGAPVPDLANVQHRIFRFHDVAGARGGLVAPSEADVSGVIAMGRLWDGRRPLLAHCQMGISRSPAAAYILACARRPRASEHALAQALRVASPMATPNPLMVALADDILGRGGRMVRAIRAIGRGAEYRPSRGFLLHVDRPEPD